MLDQEKGMLCCGTSSLEFSPQGALFGCIIMYFQEKTEHACFNTIWSHELIYFPLFLKIIYFTIPVPIFWLGVGPDPVALIPGIEIGFGEQAMVLAGSSVWWQKGRPQGWGHAAGSHPLKRQSLHHRRVPSWSLHAVASCEGSLIACAAASSQPIELGAGNDPVRFLPDAISGLKYLGTSPSGLGRGYGRPNWPFFILVLPLPCIPNYDCIFVVFTIPAEQAC